MLSQHQQEELDGLMKIRHEWVKKRNNLRLQEASQSDVSNLHTIETQINNASQRIAEYDLEISQLQQTIIPNENPLSIANSSPLAPVIITDNVVKDDTLLKAIEVVKQETKRLNYNSTKEDIAKIHSLKSKIFDEIYEVLDKQLDFFTSKKELMYSSVLFDKIYTSEILDTVTTIEIQKIRENYQIYKWYDRSIIISALSLSLFNFKFDAKKANLLLDFVTDFESNDVWERALTGLILAITYQKNRSWERSENFVLRLKTLKDKNEIQEGIKAIDFVLNNELFKSHLFNPALFKMDLFQNPMNCFVPFYENNEVLRHALESADNSYDLEEFQKYLNEMPLMNSHKYALCIGLSENLIKTETLDKEGSMKFTYSLSLSDCFSPFQNIVSEFYCFFSYFPDKVVDDVFKKQLLLTRTSLRDFILNKSMQLLLEANNLFSEKKYPSAITKYNDLLKIDRTHFEARWKLAQCYGAKNEIKEALYILLELEKEAEDKFDKELIFSIASCYTDLKNYSKSNEYLNKISDNVEKLSFKYFRLKARNFQKKHDYFNAEFFCKKAESEADDEDDYIGIATIYFSMDKNEEALRLVKKVLETKKDSANYWTFLGNIYDELSQWDLSIPALQESYKLNNKDAYCQLLLGRAYLFSQTDIVKAKFFLEKSLNGNSKDILAVLYGNFGHLFLVQKDTEKAIYNYKKCLELMDDTKEFSEKMGRDYKQMMLSEISRDDYKAIENQVIKAYMLNKAKKHD
jgi:Tfp pilus assembly protein PilF